MPEQTTISLKENFADHYLSLRRKEGRLYTDEELQVLPKVAKGHSYEHEWKIREQSSKKLIEYISSHSKSASILEMGCGNGWLSNAMAEIDGVEVTGMDINREELEQANRVFKRPNLNFIYGSTGEASLAGELYDFIIFSSSIQYFPSFINTVRSCIQILKEKGELHIIDSNFYNAQERAHAQLRSQLYFSEMGAPQMQSYYFHHCLTDLGKFQFTLLNKWQTRLEKIAGIKRSFPWICIKKQPC